MASYAILPAAGRSRRMGTAKLLLPWGRWPSLLDAVLDQWQATAVRATVCVVRSDDAELQVVCRRHAVELVVADPPPAEMKHSVALGLDHVRHRFAPHAADAWLLAPADVPSISQSLVDRLLAEHQQHREAILVPSYAGRRGHPVLFPWPLAAAVNELGPDEGVNALLDRHPVREIPWEDSQVLEDVDTPEDYERLKPGGT